MKIPTHPIPFTYATIAVMTGTLALGACKPEPPIPSVVSSAAQAASAAPDAPVADPGKAPSDHDNDLAGRIESALNAETSLHGSRIGVIAADGVVTLTGSTRTADLRSMASQIALSITGVRLVRNELAVARET